LGCILKGLPLGNSVAGWVTLIGKSATGEARTIPLKRTIGSIKLRSIDVIDIINSILYYYFEKLRINGV
jgi:hypothetical protein